MAGTKHRHFRGCRQYALSLHREAPAPRAARKRCWRWCAACLATGLSSGCALQYYDEDTGVEHLWGFGHLRMGVQQPDRNVQAVVSGGETLGFSAGTTAGGGHLAIGWRDERRILVGSENASVSFEWPDTTFMKVRVGARPPWQADEE